jgi:hypothetical protein
MGRGFRITAVRSKRCLSLSEIKYSLFPQVCDILILISHRKLPDVYRLFKGCGPCGK